jgi:hypothetical protein
LTIHRLALLLLLLALALVALVALALDIALVRSLAPQLAALMP